MESIRKTVEEIVEAPVAAMVVVAETVCPDGQREAVTLSTGAAGDVELPPWTEEGLLRFATREAAARGQEAEVE